MNTKGSLSCRGREGASDAVSPQGVRLRRTEKVHMRPGLKDAGAKAHPCPRPPPRSAAQGGPRVPAGPFRAHLSANR